MSFCGTLGAVAAALENIDDYDPVDPGAWPFGSQRKEKTAGDSPANWRPVPEKTLDKLAEHIPAGGEYDFAGDGTKEKGRDAWVKITAAWKEAGATLDQFDKWAQRGDGYDLDGNTQIWESTDVKENGATRKTLFKIARQFDYKGGIEWAVMNDRGGALRAASANAVLALQEFPDLTFEYNEFSGVDLINGVAADDRKVSQLSSRLQTQLHYCPTKDALHEAVMNMASENSFHPVRDYLEGLQWDGRPRLSRAGGNILRR